jgi:hypothetical protein
MGQWCCSGYLPAPRNALREVSVGGAETLIFAMIFGDHRVPSCNAQATGGVWEKEMYPWAHGGQSVLSTFSCSSIPSISLNHSPSFFLEPLRLKF